MHAVAAQTIVIQRVLAIVFLVEKDFAVGDAMRAGLPVRELLAVAALLALHETRDVDGAQAHRGGESAADVLHQTPHIAQMKSRIEGDQSAVALAATHAAMAGNLPHIVIHAEFPKSSPNKVYGELLTNTEELRVTPATSAQHYPG